MALQKITIQELLNLYNKHKNERLYLCWMLENELLFKIQKQTIQFCVREFFSNYFKFDKDSEYVNTVPLWVTHWVADVNPEDNIVGFLYPIDGEPITIYEGDGGNGKIRQIVLEHIAKVDPEAYFYLPQHD